MDEITNLSLHETTEIGDYEITRVPGGWIYLYNAIAGGRAVCCVFVPYMTQY